MEAYKGTPLFFGHRAWGSLLKHIFIFLIFVGGYIYLWKDQIAILHYHAHYFEYVYWFILLYLFLDLMARKYRLTYVVTTQELIVKRGIIASDIKRYVYTQVQQADSFQTIGQRLTLWGELTVTMLISHTGQATPETAHFVYIHRPKMIANMIMENLRVGQ